jgi:hypothetical protein
VNSGGEPERDDTGLPPVDIEIPDDARELDRDVQAYYREQRAERRRLRHHRLHSKIARDGIVLPLMACCLILALITGTLLTVFTATSDQNPPASSPASALNPRVRTGVPLPPGTLTFEGSGAQRPLRSLGESMLVLVPAACGCGATVRWLAGIGASDGVATYLIGTKQTIREANELHSRLPANLQRALPVVVDSQDVLAHVYPVEGVTAVMVAEHSPGGQSATYAQHLSAADNPAPLLRALTR